MTTNLSFWGINGKWEEAALYGGFKNMLDRVIQDKNNVSMIKQQNNKFAHVLMKTFKIQFEAGLNTKYIHFSYRLNWQIWFHIIACTFPSAMHNISCTWIWGNRANGSKKVYFDMKCFEECWLLIVIRMIVMK